MKNLGQQIGAYVFKSPPSVVTGFELAQRSYDFWDAAQSIKITYDINSTHLATKQTHTQDTLAAAPSGTIFYRIPKAVITAGGASSSGNDYYYQLYNKVTQYWSTVPPSLDNPGEAGSWNKNSDDNKALLIRFNHTNSWRLVKVGANGNVYISATQHYAILTNATGTVADENPLSVNTETNPDIFTTNSSVYIGRPNQSPAELNSFKIERVEPTVYDGNYKIKDMKIYGSGYFREAAEVFFGDGNSQQFSSSGTSINNTYSASGNSPLDHFDFNDSKLTSGVVSRMNGNFFRGDVKTLDELI